MASDLNTHEEGRGHIGIEMGMALLMTNNPHDMRNFIEGFN